MSVPSLVNGKFRLLLPHIFETHSIFGSFRIHLSVSLSYTDYLIIPLHSRMTLTPSSYIFSPPQSPVNLEWLQQICWESSFWTLWTSSSLVIILFTHSHGHVLCLLSSGNITCLKHFTLWCNFLTFELSK